MSIDDETSPIADRRRPSGETPRPQADVVKPSTSLLSISKDGQISFKLGSVITAIASLIAAITATGGMTMIDTLIGPNAALIAQVARLEDEAKDRQVQADKHLALTERHYKLMLRVHNITTTIDGVPIEDLP